jgi:PEP-CTERM motif-containing protein
MTHLITSGRVAVSLQVFVLAFVIAPSASAAPLLPFATLTVNGAVYGIALTEVSGEYRGIINLDLETGPVSASVRMGFVSAFMFLSLEGTNESDLPLSLSLSTGTPIEPLRDSDTPSLLANTAMFFFNVDGPLVPGPATPDGVTVTPFATDPDGDGLHEMLTVFAGDPLVNLGFDVGVAATIVSPFGGFFQDGVQTLFLPWPDYRFLSADLSYVLSPGGDFARVHGHVLINGQAPEPASLVLVGLGLAGLGWRLRRARLH